MNLNDVYYYHFAFTGEILCSQTIIMAFYAWIKFSMNVLGP